VAGFPDAENRVAFILIMTTRAFGIPLQNDAFIALWRGISRLCQRAEPDTNEQRNQACECPEIRPDKRPETRRAKTSR
jgi:hypothetical protein